MPTFPQIQSNNNIWIGYFIFLLDSCSLVWFYLNCLDCFYYYLSAAALFQVSTQKLPLIFTNTWTAAHEKKERKDILLGYIGLRCVALKRYLDISHRNSIIATKFTTLKMYFGIFLFWSILLILYWQDQMHMNIEHVFFLNKLI